MAEKTVKSRIQVKRGTSAEWALATNFVPKEGEIIFYSDLNKMKIGDGSTLVSSLPFLHVDKSEIDNWSHNHDDKYYTESEIDTKLSGKAASSHSHGNIASGGTLGTASRVVVTDSNKKVTVSSNITTTELDYLDGVTSNIQTQLNGKSATGHNHNDTYYTESEIDTKLAGKADSDHNHNEAVIYPSDVYMSGEIEISSENSYTYLNSYNVSTPEIYTDNLYLSGSSVGIDVDFGDSSNSITKILPGAILLGDTDGECFSRLLPGEIKTNEIATDKIKAPTSSNSSTLGYGSNGQVLKSNGSSVYWANDNNTNTWRKVQLNGTDKLGTGTSTNPLNIKAGSNMTITESGGTFTFAATDTNTWRPIGTGASDAAAGNHTHDGRYYTESEIDTKLAGKAASDHTHTGETWEWLSLNSLTVGNQIKLEGDSSEDEITIAPGYIMTPSLQATDVDTNRLIVKQIQAPTSSNSSTSGYGSNGQVLKSNGSTIYWAADNDTNTHYTTGLYVGATNAKSNAATSNGGTYLKLYDDSTKRAEFKITGSGATTVTSDANGNITISSTDTNTNTTYSAGTGLQLSGTTFSTKLNSTTSLGTIGTTSKLYAVGVDANGKLCVNVPWTDNNTTYTFNGAISTIKDSNLTASRALISNSSGKVAVSDVTSTELSYLDGVTSNIQTQLNGKAASSHGTHVTADTVKSALGTGTGTTKYLREDGTWVTPPDTNTTYSLVGANGTTGLIKNGSSVTSTSGLTACPIINGVPYYKDTNTTYSLSSFGITASATELNYVDGVTSNIQTQLDGKAASSHGTHVSYGGNGSATTVSRSDHTHDYSNTYAAKSHSHSEYVAESTFDEFTSYAESNYATRSQLGDQVTYSYNNGTLTITSK